MRAYVLVWEFLLQAGKEKEFVEQYGCNGPWCSLFARSSDYLKTELIHDALRPERYLTLDYWSSKQAWQNFLQENKMTYESIDESCKALTESERLLGSFYTVESD